MNIPAGGASSGLDRVLAEGLSLPGRGRAAVLCNASTVSRAYLPTVEALAACGVWIERVFSPQHGFALEKQDNMVESADGVHPRLGVPIVSLYGERREPLPDAFDGCDVLLIDLQDVGTRVYTFLVTALLALRVAASRGIPTVVLDRPNPVGGAMDGPLLTDACRSFVGIVDVPLQHGLTAGEYCLYGAWRLGVGDTRSAHAAPCEGPVSVVRMLGWTPGLYEAGGDPMGGIPWTMPSPNMPTPDTAAVYPGQVMLEATNVSEGRGTTRPFEIFGAPFIDPDRLAATILPEATAGARLRVVAFEPTFHKHRGRTCSGFQIHVTERRAFRPVAFSAAMIAAVAANHPADFRWREPPYEYEWDRPAIDLITGDDALRRCIDGGGDVRPVIASWGEGVARFTERVRPFLLYDRTR